ncbi:hypothetical protein [Phascolarctobacterium faecium]|uniref:hypothetical protein n=1 Tax=Phascolarctobacterium faecium TaxID=33025 RepID=UPI00242FAB3F|nr:hypothetical protein [Phascolarctobacterium faecium]
MLSFLAMIIFISLLLCFTISAVIFIGGFSYHALKDFAKEVAIAKEKANIEPLTINKKSFYKFLAVLSSLSLLFYISNNTASPSLIVGSIIGSIALACYCFYQAYTEHLKSN